MVTTGFAPYEWATVSGDDEAVLLPASPLTFTNESDVRCVDSNHDDPVSSWNTGPRPTSATYSVVIQLLCRTTRSRGSPWPADRRCAGGRSRLRRPTTSTR